MRLGEFRTKTRDFDNRLRIMLSDYDDLDEPIKELEVDMVTDNVVYLRIV